MLPISPSFLPSTLFCRSSSSPCSSSPRERKAEGDGAVQGIPAHARLLVLGEQLQSPSVQLLAAAQGRLILLLHAHNMKEKGALVNRLKAVGVFLQRFFRLTPGRIVVPGVPQAVKPLYAALQAAALLLKAQQGVHRGFKEIRQLHQKRNLRRTCAGFPNLKR